MKLVVLLSVILLILAGCADGAAPERSISRSDLESKVAEIYPPKSPDTKVTVRCEGGLPAELDATQECRVSVNKQRAQVRVTVSEVQGDDTTLEAEPFVPADRVAEELLAALTDEGYHVEKVACPSELPGSVGSQVTCTVTPNRGDGGVVATVTAVRGLHVDFDYEAVS
jgi:hypothetical protein